MTIASKLFYGRRSLTDRRSFVAQPEELNPSGRTHCRHCSKGQHGSLQEPNGDRHLPPPHHHQQQKQKFQRKRFTSNFGEGTYNTDGYVTTRVNYAVSGYEPDRHLPISVLQARARLLERLSTLYLTETRKEIIPKDAFLHECGHLEELNSCKIEIEPFVLHSGAVHSQVTQMQNFVNLNCKPALVVGDRPLKFLEEVFARGVESDESAKAPLECSICLERFLEGEKAIRLPCGHMYHLSCIEPWVESHGVCPYCRAMI